MIKYAFILNFKMKLPLGICRPKGLFRPKAVCVVLAAAFRQKLICTACACQVQSRVGKVFKTSCKNTSVVACTERNGK